MEKRELLEYFLIILLCISGAVYDLLIFPIIQPDELSHLMYQAMCREIMIVGPYLLAFKAISYKNIKLKAFTFMFAMRSIIVVIHNNFYDTQINLISYMLFAIFLFWLIRIALIKKETDNTQLHRLKLYEMSGVAYNILLPVKTFRGLLQILFTPWHNPLYETRLLVAEHKIYGVKNKRFVKTDYNYEYVKALVNKGFKIKECHSYKKNAAEYLVGKKMIFGFRDCRRLDF